MNIKNINLIEILLSSGIQANNLVDIFWIIGKLSKKHWKVLYTKKYIDEISVVDEGLASIITLLNSVNKTTHKDTKKLIEIIKSTQDSYQKEFIVNAPKEYQEIKEYLQEKFKNSKVRLDVVDNTEIKINWEWRYYKKSLDSDLERILGL